MRSYELKPVYDGRKSFYGKAVVEDDGVSVTLYSYKTPVCVIDTVGDLGKPMFCLLDKWDYSDTTLRHVREFLRQMVGSRVPASKALLGRLAPFATHDIFPNPGVSIVNILS